MHESGFGTKRTSRHVRCSVAIGGKADIEQAALRTRFMSTRPSVRGRLVRHSRLAQAPKTHRRPFLAVRGRLYSGPQGAACHPLTFSNRAGSTTIQRFYLLALH
jgi:hypothetical protein